MTKSMMKRCGYCSRLLGFPKEDWEWKYFHEILPICNECWCNHPELENK